jgi:sugar lactone lactonase YvrE
VLRRVGAISTVARDVELVVDARADTGEGPLWDAAAGVLWWLDVTGQKLHRYAPDDTTDGVVHLDRPVGALTLRASGGLVAAANNGFCELDPVSGALTLIAGVEGDDPSTRMNDGKCDSAGRFYAGTMAVDAQRGAGSFYRLNQDSSVTRLFSGVTISNGLDWSPDGSTLYYIDTALGAVDAFDFDCESGDLANRRTLVRVDRELGLPDGMCVDSEGWLWIACWRGGAVRRIAPDGTHGAAIELPVSQVTSCAFGGADLGDLYITTGRRHLTPARLAAEAESGALFRCRPGYFGSRPHACRA